MLVRGHSRTSGFEATRPQSKLVRDVTNTSDVNDLLLASDLLVTDYSSIMFDASVALVPTLFFVPDLFHYQDEDRGFTFEFESAAPGPLLTEHTEVLQAAKQFFEHGTEAEWTQRFLTQSQVWRTRFNACDDGKASARIVSALIERKIL